MKAIITRFAPSPTGNLHIGGLRTALINYIVTEKAKKEFPNSKFLLRIEDTDKLRSESQYLDNIYKGLDWMGIKYDEVFIQSKRIKRHQEIALELIKRNKAYKCICKPADLQLKRNQIINNKKNNKRLCDNCEKNSDIQSLKNDFAIRIKIPIDSKTEINDEIQGCVEIQNKELDNFILLRNDGSPTYMLSSVVDDYDMGVNLIIRGDDHLNNTFRQFYIYKNMDWDIPVYAHIPLIHGEDGKKLSKRHGSVDVNDFKKIGYLKEAIINNLILLGWAPKNHSEIISIEEIIELFDLKKISKSSSIFSYDKLNFFNNNYIKKDNKLLNLLDYSKKNKKIEKYLNEDYNKFLRVFEIYKKNLNYYKDLEDILFTYFHDNFEIKNKILLNDSFNILINEFLLILDKIELFNIEILEKNIDEFLSSKKIKFSEFGKPTRLILINSLKGPSISEILFILDKKDSIKRIKNYIDKI